MSHGKLKDDLYQAVNHELEGRLALGVSKRGDRSQGLNAERIYSANTFNGYRRNSLKFAEYVVKHSPGGRFTTLEEAKHYAPAYIADLKAKGYSASSLKTKASALGKLFHCAGTEFGDTGVRHRSEITRGRRPTKISEKTGKTIKNRSTYAGRFSEKKHPEIVSFMNATGLRKAELQRLKGNQLLHNDGPAHYSPYGEVVKLYNSVTGSDVSAKNASFKVLVPSGDFLIIRGKGGRVRCAPVLQSGADLVRDKCGASGYKKVFDKLPSNLDVHSYRARYAQTLYKDLARDTDHFKGSGKLAEINRIKDPATKKHALENYYQENVLKLLAMDPAQRAAEHPSRSEIYFCRDDLVGVHYDKIAMSAVSEALGHSRICVIAGHYLNSIIT